MGFPDLHDFVVAPVESPGGSLQSLELEESEKERREGEETKERESSTFISSKLFPICCS